MENNPKTKNLPSVAIIILNWNGLNNTINCLNSLKKSNYNNYNIIIIDNNSKNNELEKLQNIFGDYIHPIACKKNFGFAEGNNIGIRFALNQNVNYILILNNDTEVTPNFLNELTKTAHTNNSIGMVAPKMLKMVDKKTVDNLGITLTLSGLAFNRKNEKLKIFCPSGGAALYKVEMLKKILEKNNYFDPDYFAYAEDLDLGFRAVLSGYKSAYSEKSVVYHKGSASTSVMSDFAVYHTQRNLILTIIKDFPIHFLLKNILWILFLQLGIIFLFLKRKRVKIIIKANIDAFKFLPKFIKKRKYIQKNKKISLSEFNKSIENKIIINDYLTNALKYNK